MDLLRSWLYGREKPEKILIQHDDLTITDKNDLGIDNTHRTPGVEVAVAHTEDTNVQIIQNDLGIDNTNRMPGVDVTVPHAEDTAVQVIKPSYTKIDKCGEMTSTGPLNIPLIHYAGGDSHSMVCVAQRKTSNIPSSQDASGSQMPGTQHSKVENYKEEDLSGLRKFVLRFIPLQPGDCLECKLVGTTVMVASGIIVLTSAVAGRKRNPNLIGRKLVTYYSLCGSLFIGFQVAAVCRLLDMGPFGFLARQETKDFTR